MIYGTPAPPSHRMRHAPSTSQVQPPLSRSHGETNSHPSIALSERRSLITRPPLDPFRLLASMTCSESDDWTSIDPRELGLAAATAAPWRKTGALVFHKLECSFKFSKGSKQNSGWPVGASQPSSVTVRRPLVRRVGPGSVKPLTPPHCLCTGQEGGRHRPAIFGSGFGTGGMRRA